MKKNTKIAGGYGERGREKRERAIGGGGREAGCQRHRQTKTERVRATHNDRDGAWEKKKQAESER